MILFGLALAWLAGVGCAALGLAWLWPLLSFGGAGVCAGLALSDQRWLAVATVICILVAMAGMWRHEDSRPPASPGGIAAFNDSYAVVVRGEVSAAPEERERSQRFPVRVSEYRDETGWRETHGSVLITARPFPRFEYGDKLEFRVRLETPPKLEGFDYREYLARRGIVSVGLFPEIKRTGSGGGSVVVRLLTDLRRPPDEALKRSLPEPEASLARGILLGQRASIPRNVTDDFNRSGISHLVAISGWNVTLAAGFAVGGLAWLLGRRQATVAAMLIVALYAAYVGGSPSVLRALVMGEVMLGASLVGRPGSALTAVCVAGAILTLLNPLAVDDVAFQLSFAATVGIVLLQKPFEEWLHEHMNVLPYVVAQSCAVTLAATVAVLPIIASTFGRISLIALLANLVAVPVFPIVITASALTAIAGTVSTGLGEVVGEVSYLPLAYLVLVAELASGLPAASVAVGNLGVIDAALMYGVIGLLLIALLRYRTAPAEPNPRPLRVAWPVTLAGLTVIAAAFVWWDAFSSSDEDYLTITVLDVGQGDAILIETAAGKRILVDGGPSGSMLLQELGRELPASVRRFDLVVLTHGQDDHVTGLVSLLERYQVDGALAGPRPGETAANRAWREGLARRSVLEHEATAGQWADLGDGVRLEVLGPLDGMKAKSDNLNDQSVVLRLVYGKVSFLLTGDIEAAAEAALIANGGDLRSTVLKVAHHGSDGSTLPPFLAAVDPAIAVISAGAENTYGHPSPSTLVRLGDLPVLRTDENGSVRFQTDGTRLWVDFDRGDYRLVSRPKENDPDFPGWR